MAVGADPVVLEDIERARIAMGDVVRRTPVLSSRTISESAGATVALKAENLQRTGSFKLRGALAKLSALGDRARDGVVAGSAGNHAQSLAYAARVRGVPCEVFMPTGAAIAKVEAAAELGAEVVLAGESVHESVIAAEERAAEAGLHLVHPFDDPDIVAGQGTVGLELVEDVADLAAVVVPVGGGGLASGIAIAVKALRPEVKIIGVQAEACSPVPASLRTGRAVNAEGTLTIADGIAVKRAGVLTLELLHRWVDDVVVVPEDDIAEAMVLLLERAKLVVEGAGAVGVAALLGGAWRAHPAVPPWRCSRAATSAPGCSPPSRAATRPRPDGASCCSPASTTGQAASRSCSRSSPSVGPTSWRSRTCARGSTCTCARPPSNWCSRPAVATTPASACGRLRPRATTCECSARTRALGSPVMGKVGRVIAVACALLIPLFLLLPFVNQGAHAARDYTGWEIFSGADMIVTIDGLAVVALAIGSLWLQDSPVYGGVIIALGAFVFGHMLPEEADPVSSIGIGAWLVNAAALGIIVGGVLMVIESLKRPRHAQSLEG